jgi:ADP-ribose pyrophosphatase YjhB (NUDIX family)
MSFAGSYVWKIRQSIGHSLLVMPAVEVVPMRGDRVLMVYNRDFDTWAFPSGGVGPDLTWQEAAVCELRREAAVEAESTDLIPIMAVSGEAVGYPNGDLVQPYVLAFLVRDFVETDNEPDSLENEDKRWFTLDDAEVIVRDEYERALIAGLREYSRTGEFQMIELDRPARISDDDGPRWTHGGDNLVE